MMATVNLLNYMPENHPKRNEIIALLQRQIKNIAQYQNKSGMWNQVLHKQDSYQETSCTAMFTYSIALAVRKGWVESRYKTIALAGWEGVKSQIQKDGGVTNICTGTAIGNDLKFYYDRPTPYNDIHALGAIILGGIEVSKLLQ
jgi:rhamnogalacturonyl hydrolase YesR